LGVLTGGDFMTLCGGGFSADGGTLALRRLTRSS